MDGKEAEWVAFTDIYVDGRRVSMTIREGMTEEKIREMVGLTKVFHDQITETFGLSATALPVRDLDEDTAKDQTQPQTKVAPKTTRTSQRATESNVQKGDGVYETTVTNADGRAFTITQYTKEPGPDGLWVHVIDGITISGTVDKPMVELKHSKLQWPVAKQPDWVVRKCMTEEYVGVDGDDLDYLKTIGTTRQVNWVCYFEPSEKVSARGNPYKNLVRLRDLDLEGDIVASGSTGEFDESAFWKWVRGDFAKSVGNVERAVAIAEEELKSYDNDYETTQVALIGWLEQDEATNNQFPF